MAPRCRATLAAEERQELEALTRAATKTTGKRFLFARALLLCDWGPHGPGWSVARTAEALGVATRTIERLQQRFVEQGLEAALERKRRVKPPREVIFDGAFEARLIAGPAGSEPLDATPAGGQGRGTGLGRVRVGTKSAQESRL